MTLYVQCTLQLKMLVRIILIKMLSLAVMMMMILILLWRMMFLFDSEAADFVR